MITEHDFLALLGRMESETLDFKAPNYNLSEEWSRAYLLKDVLCMANTPREESAFIILGVKKHANGSYDLRGLDRQVDDADLQSQFTERVYPIPEFTYEVLNIKASNSALLLSQLDG